MSIQLYNTDCLEVLKNMDDGSIDCTITSPPYNMGLRIKNGKYIKREKSDCKYKNFSDDLSLDEFYDFYFKVLTELIRVSKLVFYNFGIVTGSKRAFFRLMGDFNENIKDVIVWDKVRSPPAICSGVLTRRTELILVFSNDAISRRFLDCNFSKGTEEDLWVIQPIREINEINQAGFPIGLPVKILSLFGKKGDVVFDPFLGTGTTGRAAARLGFDFIGCEIDRETFEFARKNIDNETQQLKLWV